MISQLGEKLATMLVFSDVIASDDIELYSYGFFLILSKCLYLIVAVVLGIIFHVLWESITFYVLFSTLREYTGGIHAETEAKCIVSSILMLFVSISGISYMSKMSRRLEAFILLIVGCVAIFLLAPKDSLNRQLSANEKRHYQCLSRYLTIVYVTLSILTACIYDKIFYTVTMVIYMVGVLLVADIIFSKIKRQTGID